MEIEKRVNEKGSRREAARGVDGGGTEREFYVFEIAFPTDSGGKICEHHSANISTSF